MGGLRVCRSKEDAAAGVSLQSLSQRMVRVLERLRDRNGETDRYVVGFFYCGRVLGGGRNAPHNLFGGLFPTGSIVAVGILDIAFPSP